MRTARGQWSPGGESGGAQKPVHQRGGGESGEEPGPPPFREKACVPDPGAAPRVGMLLETPLRPARRRSRPALPIENTLQSPAREPHEPLGDEMHHEKADEENDEQTECFQQGHNGSFLRADSRSVFPKGL